MKTFKIGQTVKFKYPEIGEENFTFIVNEVHEKSENIAEKLHVTLICTDYIKPTFCYFSTEFTQL